MVNHRVTFNISGDIFETRETTLNRFPNTLLGDIHKRQKYFCCKSSEYYFNRNRQSFEAILYFYQSDGDLRLPPNLRLDTFVRECKFYQIPSFYIESMKEKAGFSQKTPKKKILKRSKNEAMNNKKLRTKIWNFLENPETSTPAKSFAIFSLLVIFTSVILSCIETMSSFKDSQDSFTTVELILNSWFLLEVTLRFLFAPDKLSFLKQFLNIVDIIGVVPYFIVLTIKQSETTSLSFLRMLRFLRVLRLFRLSKHSERIQTVGAILKDSLQDLYVFLLCLVIMTIFSGAILYFMESRTANSKFISIPQGMWWALQTVVTLGYGDIVAVTWYGKIYSAFFMIFGALTISLPVLSIVMKFTKMYLMAEGGKEKEEEEEEEEEVYRKEEDI